ncbi:MAG: hypothetical protein SCARUB_03988 [Candidatus Scalindua rubra]|uniref:Uncharacterized protein n=1 Tax=Candidatus Scalindua rubra TaxID=1872076 RepID=A0A1E3X5J7_9BACT|nr:MAG: hypothetical protein SCARUB_03988 [Candidatus Scalindua rubra]
MLDDVKAREYFLTSLDRLILNQKEKFMKPIFPQNLLKLCGCNRHVEKSIREDVRCVKGKDMS